MMFVIWFIKAATLVGLFLAVKLWIKWCREYDVCEGVQVSKWLSGEELEDAERFDTPFDNLLCLARMRKNSHDAWKRFREEGPMWLMFLVTYLVFWHL